MHDDPEDKEDTDPGTIEADEYESDEDSGVYEHDD